MQTVLGQSQGLSREGFVREVKVLGGVDRYNSKCRASYEPQRATDELRWVKKVVECEDIPMTDEALELRRDIAKGLEAIWAMTLEDRVRHRVAALNSLILRKNAAHLSKPAAEIELLDAEEIVRSWRRKATAV